MSGANCCGVLNVNGANLSSEWEQIESLPKKIFHSSAIAVEGEIYIFGGRDQNENYLKSTFVYDPQTNKYSQKADMPIGKSHIDSIAEHNGYIYIVGGASEAGGTNSVHRYNIDTDKWEQLANLPTKRSGMSVVEFNGLVYAIGGWVSEKNVGIVEVYNSQNNTWSRKKDMPTPRRYLSSFIYDGKIYVAGGYLGDKGTAVVEVYDPVLNTWSNASQMKINRASFGISEHNGIFYAFGGGKDTIEKYDPVSDSWTLLNCKIPQEITGFGIANLSSVSYFFGGYNRTSPSGLINAYKYTPIGIDAPTIELISDNTIDWEEVQGASSYNVCRKIDDGSYELIAENVTDTSFTDNKQEPGKTHYYVVRSVNEEGISCHSNEVLVNVEDTPRYERALLVIRTMNDDWFEYDLTEDEVNDFVHWYDNVPSDDLKAYYVFDKDFNIGPFKSRKDHIVHDKIVFFEIKEY